MTENQRIWAENRDRMAEALGKLGYPESLADLLAGELKNPRAMERMTAYLRGVRPHSMEMIVDEMLAICADVRTWQEKKEAQASQARYNAWLNSDARWQMEEEEEDGEGRT